MNTKGEQEIFSYGKRRHTEALIRILGSISECAPNFHYLSSI